jgi:hypothetical protein
MDLEVPQEQEQEETLWDREDKEDLAGLINTHLSTFTRTPMEFRNLLIDNCPPLM